MKRLALVLIVSGCTYAELDDATCPEESSYSAILTGANQQLAIDECSGASWSQELRFVGALSADPDIELNVFVYGGGGQSSTPDWPTTLGAGPAELEGTSSLDAYAFIDTDFAGAGGAPQTEYIAISGSLDVTSADGQTFSGTLSNAMFAQGSSDANGFEVISGGCSTAFSGSFSATIQPAN